nr:diguanylate cyclase [Kineococcus siccus]
MRELGRGTGTVVHLASRGGREHAVKRLSPVPDTVAARAVAEHQLRREAALLASVDHPGLSRVHAVERIDGDLAIVMRAVEGSTLAQLLHSPGERPGDPAGGPAGAGDPPGPGSRATPGAVLRVATSVGLALDLCDALDALHRSGLVHRDVKPGNVVVTPRGHGVLIDLGVAHLAAPAGPDAVATAVGSLSYCAPEQAGALRRPVDHRADLYSLGAVLHECLTGRPPVQGTDAEDVRRRLRRLAPLDTRVLGDDVPTALAELLRQLLAADPDDRPASARAVASVLARVERELSPQAAAERRRGPRSVPPPLLERAPQIALLDSAWDAARTGAGGVVHVRGPAGSGRSSLAAHLARRALAGGATTVVLDTTTAPSAPLAGLREALRRAGLAAELDAAGPDGGGGEPLAEELAQLLLACAARRGPVLVVVDDAEHAEASTVAVLRSVAGECRDLPVLVAVVDRPGAGHLTGPGEAAGRTIVVDVPALSEAAARAVVRRRLPGAAVPDAVAASLTARAAGNPGALRAVLNATLDDGGLLPQWGRWTLEAAVLDAVPVGPDLLDALLGRFAGLARAQQRVLRLAAASGRLASEDLVRAAAAPELGPEAVDDALAAGVATRLLRPGQRGWHEFPHQQVVDALLAGTPGGERRALHARLARVLRTAAAGEPGAPTIAGGGPDLLFASARQHLLAGDAVAPADVVSACAAAGLEAARRHAHASAVPLLENAARVAHESGTDLDPALRRALAASCARTGHHRRAHVHLEQLLADDGGDPVQRSVVLGEVALLHRHERAAAGPLLALRAVDRGLAELGLALPVARSLPVASSLPTAPSPRGGPLAAAPRLLLTCLRAALLALLPTGRRARAARADTDASAAVLLREGASAALVVGAARWRALPVLVAALVLARASRRADVVEDCTTDLRAGLRQLLGSRPSLVPVRLPGPGPASREDPTALARTRLGTALDRLHHGGTWRTVADVLEEQGAWLDLPAHLEGVAHLGRERLSAGHGAQAREWFERGVRRLPDGAPAPVALQLLEVLLLAADGRPGAAGEVLRAVDAETRVTPGAAALPHGLAVAGTTLRWLTEQGDVGPRFDEAAIRFERLAGRGHRHRTRSVRDGAGALVQGRLDQCAAAAAAGDAARLAGRQDQLRRALPLLGRRGGSRLEQAWRRLLLAEAAGQLGRPRTAARRLQRAQHLAATLDAPLLTHRALLLLARERLAQGAVADADRHRWLATVLAERQGWPNLVRRAQQAAQQTQPAPRTAAGRRAADTALGRAGDAVVTTGTRSHRAPDAGRRRLLAAMRDVGDAAQVLDPLDLVRLALDQACDLLGADRAVLHLSDRAGGLAVFAGRTAAGTDLPGSGPGGSADAVDPTVLRAARTGRPVVLGVPAPETSGAGGDVPRSVVAVPLLVRGRRTGVLSVVSTLAQGAFGRSDVELLQLIAGQVALSLATARAARLEIEVHGAQRERDLAEAVRRVTEEVSGSLDLRTVRARLLVAAVRELGADRGALVPAGVAADGAGRSTPALVSDAVGPVRGAVGERRWPTPDAPGHDAPDDGPDDGLDAATTAVLGRTSTTSGSGPLPAALAGLLDDAGADARRDPAAVRVPGRWLVAPLRDRTGRVAEALVLVADDGGLQERAHVASALAAPAAVALENARLFAQVEHLARTDSLTGVATRGHLLRLGEQRVQRVRAGGPGAGSTSLAALMVDVDHFKAVNDRYGHATGDEVLSAVARRLRGAAREGDVLGRYGGEEFALVVAGAGEGADAREVDVRDLAERLRRGVDRTPVEVRGERLQVTVSVGVALLRRDERLTDVLARADTALYAAKAAGRNTVAVAP